MKPAARSAVGPSTLPSTAAPRRGAGGGGVDTVEHVVNPSITGDGLPWDNAGNAIGIGGGALAYAEDGFANGVLDPVVPNGATAELTLLYDSNVANAAFQVILVDSNGEIPVSQVVYNDVPPAGGGSISVPGISITNNRDVIRVNINTGGGVPNVNVTYVSLTTPAP